MNVDRASRMIDVALSVQAAHSAEACASLNQQTKDLENEAE